LIDDKESEQLFRQLAEALRTSGMGWVVDQVYEHIASGKGVHAVSVKFPRQARRVVRGEEEEPDRGRPGFTGRIEFTAQERLKLLADSAVSVVRDSVDIDEALTKEFGKVRFVPEVPEESERGFEIDRPDEARRSSIERLERWLREFNAELER
jgi:hypothetical protein